MVDQQSQETTNALIQKDIGSINKSIVEINEKLDNKYVTKEEFGLVQKIVYAEVGMVIIAFMGFLINLALRK